MVLVVRKQKAKWVVTQQPVQTHLGQLLMEVFSFPQFPASSSLVHFALYTNVSNAAVLRKRIIDAASAQGLFGEQEREAVNFSFIDARLVGQRRSFYESHDSLRPPG